MIAADPAYARPQSLDEALELLAQKGAIPLAGGQHLVPLLVERDIAPTLLVDISRIADLRRIVVSHDTLIIGAGATLSDAMAVEVAITAPLLRTVLASVATLAVRNRGTLVGNLVVANPRSELPVALLALDAQLVLRRPGATRTVALEDFLVGSHRTLLVTGEVVTEVRVPLASAGQTVGAFCEITPRASALPLASVAVSLQADRHGIVHVARIVAGGVRTVPARCRAHEAALIGRPIARCAAVVADHVPHGLEPSPELTESTYAAEVVGTLIRRAVATAAAQFKSDHDERSET